MTEARKYRKWPWFIAAAMVPPLAFDLASSIASRWNTQSPNFDSGGYNFCVHVPTFGIVPFMVALILIAFLQPIRRDPSLRRWTREWCVKRLIPVFLLMGALITAVILVEGFALVLI